ncbi:MAG: 30S ribosomal protein S13 [Nanoarchaeota archaeon]|nr:30S ribosomal protein S13 [Nanoarchaeota archaeon]
MEKTEQEKTDNKKYDDRVVRILSKDIEGKMKIYPGLTKVKGISWSFSNSICIALKLDKNRKIGSLTESEVKKIEDFAKNPSTSKHLLNRRKDFTSGEDKHLIGSDLELTHEFDIKRLKKIKTYRGLRHTANLPSRGQRTKSNFRKNRRKGSGIKKKTVKK